MSASIPGTIEFIYSITLTSAPNRLYTDPNSKPITPPPMTNKCFGISGSLSASVEVIILSLSKEMNGKFLNHLNVGTGKDISIKKLAEKIAKITKFEGEIKWDKSKPDGTPRKLLDISRITNLGWQPKITLNELIIEMINKDKEEAKKEILSLPNFPSKDAPFGEDENNNIQIKTWGDPLKKENLKSH